MLRRFPVLLLRRTSPALAVFGKGKKAPPVEDKTLLGKVKKEAIKMLKIQLVMVPVLAIGLLVFFPIPSEEEEKRMKLEYEKSSGWKT